MTGRMSLGSKWQEGCHWAQSGRKDVIGLKVAGRMSLGCHWAQSGRKDVIGLKVAGRMSLGCQKWQEGCHWAVIGLSLGSKWQEGCHWAQSGRKDVIGLKVAGRMSLGCHWAQSGRKDDIGVRGVCLRWFSSYLQDRCQSVCIAGVSSPEARLPFGVPQGSVLGPALFVIYTAQIAEITREHLLLAHFYADDSQLYVAFSPQEPGDEESIGKVSAQSGRKQMSFACPPRIRHYVQGDHLIVGDTSIAPSASARNLGVIFDAEMNLQAHIRKVCQVSYMHLRNIASIRPALTDKAAECLIHAFITSRLDCCNSLLDFLEQPSASFNPFKTLLLVS